LGTTIAKLPLSDVRTILRYAQVLKVLLTYVMR